MKLSPFQQMFIVGIGGLIVIIFSSWVLFLNDSPPIQSDPYQKCYGDKCTNPYLSNEIVGADFTHKYVVVSLKNGTQLTTTCLTNEWTFSENATAWWCGMELHTITYVRNP